MRLVKGNAAADIIKIAMINIFNEFNKQNLKSKMILQIHDELIFNVYKDEEKIVKEIIKEKMENNVKMHVNIICYMHFFDFLVI